MIHSPASPAYTVVLGDPHHVVVVPEQRRALVHRIVADGFLAGREEVLRPAVVGRRRQAAVEVHDGMPAERGHVVVGAAAAEAGMALHRHAVGVGRGRGDRHRKRERALQLVYPLDRDGPAALGLDRWPGDQPS